MRTKDWATWAEIVASVAVIITLIFLVYEVRQNTKALERQTMLERSSRLVGPYMSSGEFRAIYAKIKRKDGREESVAAFVDSYGLSDEEAVYWVRSLEQNFAGVAADYYRDGPTAELERLFTGLLSFPDAMLYWRVQGSKGVHGAEFTAYANSILADGGR